MRPTSEALLAPQFGR